MNLCLRAMLQGRGKQRDERGSAKPVHTLIPARVRSQHPSSGGCFFGCVLRSHSNHIGLSRGRVRSASHVRFVGLV